ncbi:MAG: FAD-dependent oxidoreductase, partial [Acidobacteriota bacterium]
MAEIQADYSKLKEVLVIGGGVAGITAAVEAAEAGCRVVLVEKEPFLGGRVARTHLYFPKLCPPACGLEINLRRIKNNPNIRVLTLAEVVSLEGSPGNYQATVKLSPRYVTDACTLCDACAKACPAERSNEFDLGLSRTRAAYLPHNMAFPATYVIDRSACKPGCQACADACSYGAVDLNQQAVRQAFPVAAVVAATGWKPYDAARLDKLGFGRHPNVITNVMMERLAAANGPTGGRVLRPSDSKAPESVAFVQ